MFNHLQELFLEAHEVPSVPSVFKHPNKTIRSENDYNNNHKTSSQLYNPFNYSFPHHLILIFNQTIPKRFLNRKTILIQ